MSALVKMPDLTRSDSEKTVVTMNGDPSEEFPNSRTTTTIAPAELEYPDGGIRAWLVVCGVRIHFFTLESGHHTNIFIFILQTVCTTFST